MPDEPLFSRRRWSGAHKDAQRDPMSLADIVSRIINQYSWQKILAEYTLLNMLPTIIGEDIYQHITSVELDGAVLKFITNSTAWATQLRYMEKKILELINNSQDYRIKRILVYGPKAPNWRFGPKHISGRGPRDTFG